MATVAIFEVMPDKISVSVHLRNKINNNNNNDYDDNNNNNVNCKVFKITSNKKN
jgi:hypothetical protein